VVDLDLLPPPGMDMPLWRSLLLNLADRISPEKLPPLQLTSRPVDVGLLFGDRLALPWYRTVFANISDVVSTDTAPPLELTSTPVDVGQLLGDELDEGWWRSLMAGLRDRLSPERLPALELTSRPMEAYGAKAWLQVLDWSSLLDTPKVFLPDAEQPASDFAGAIVSQQFEDVAGPASLSQEQQELIAIQIQFKRDLGLSRFRKRVWIGVVAAEFVGLIAYAVHFR
jgi:hypothetical protein